MAKKNILVVDDEVEIREIIEGVLSGESDVTLSFATNGEEALEKIRMSAFDVLITDLAMPKMNGFELLRRLKIIGKTLPTIVLTGHGDKAIASQLRGYGVQDFINKPWNNENFIKTVQKLLHYSKLSAS